MSVQAQMFLDTTTSPLLDLAVGFDECTDDDMTDGFQFWVKQGRHWFHRRVLLSGSTEKLRGLCAVITHRRNIKIGDWTTLATRCAHT